MRVIYKLVGKAKKKFKFVVHQCTVCNNDIETRIYEFEKHSKICKKCSNLKKLEKARIVGDCNRSRPYECLYKTFLKHAKRKNIDNDISYEQFIEFANDPYCHYCLKQVNFYKYNLTKNGSSYNLDRKDNNLSYSKDNCVVCCWKCNNGKSNSFSYYEWFNMTNFLRVQVRFFLDKWFEDLDQD